MPSDSESFASAGPPSRSEPASQSPQSSWPRQPPLLESLGAPWVPAEGYEKLGAFTSIATDQIGNWIDRFRRAGIAADRRTSPDLFAQFGQALRRPIDTVLCSALDVDPGACLNSTLASRFPLEVAAAVTLIGKLTHARRAAVITDTRVPSGWHSSLRRAAAASGIRVDAIINDYPQADPTLMLYTLLNRRLRPGRPPTDQGVVLFDAAAAVAVGRFAILDEPMLQTPIVLRDHTTNRSFYRTVPIGMTLGEICQRIGIQWRNRVQRAGDLLRDIQIRADAIVGGGELIFHVSNPSPSLNPSPCIRCGWCVDACPTRVQPAAVLEACQRTDIDLAERAGIEACIECGVCSYVCPSQLPLLEGIRKMKQVERNLRLEPAV